MEKMVQVVGATPKWGVKICQIGDKDNIRAVFLRVMFAAFQLRTLYRKEDSLLKCITEHYLNKTEKFSNRASGQQGARGALLLGASAAAGMTQVFVIAPCGLAQTVQNFLPHLSQFFSSGGQAAGEFAQQRYSQSHDAKQVLEAVRLPQAHAAAQWASQGDGAVSSLISLILQNSK